MRQLGGIVVYIESGQFVISPSVASSSHAGPIVTEYRDDVNDFEITWRLVFGQRMCM